MSNRFAHIINPVSEKENSALFEVQHYTLESIINAREVATSASIRIENLAVFTHGNRVNLPSEFNVVGNSLRTTDAFLKTTKKVPFINDLIKILNDYSTAQYLIFTNIDICLMPNFYCAVDALLKCGHDALIINRRRISENHLKEGNIQLMYADVGLEHPGYDTFVFKKSLLEKFVLGDIALGIPPAGNDLFYNIFAFANKPKLCTNLHLTFHIGIDLVKTWADNAIVKNNYKEFRKILFSINPHIDISKFPASNRIFVKRHLKWLMNPTISYPKILKLDIKNLGKPRGIKPKKEIPGIKHRYYEWLIKHIRLD